MILSQRIVGFKWMIILFLCSVMIPSRSFCTLIPVCEYLSWYYVSLTFRTGSNFSSKNKWQGNSVHFIVTSFIELQINAQIHAIHWKFKEKTEESKQNPFKIEDGVMFDVMSCRKISYMCNHIYFSFYTIYISIESHNLMPFFWMQCQWK